MDAYKVGIEIAITNSASAAIGVLAKDLLGLKGNVDHVGAAFKAWTPAIQGAIALVTGGALIGGLAKIVEHGQELVHVQQQLDSTGVTAQESAQATAKSWEMAAKYGLKVSDVLADIKEAQMVFGSTEHAIDFIDPLERMRVVLNSATEGSGDAARDAVYKMARAGELKGLQTPDQFVKYFDGMTKAITASGGKIDPNSFLQATQYGRIGAKGWSEEFYTKFLPSMIQEMGPSQAGNSLMSLYGALVQGKMSKRSLQMAEDLGLIGDPSKVFYDKQGNAAGMKPGAIVGTDVMTTNPMQWAQTVLHDALVKKFGDFQPGDQRVLAELGGIFGNRTSAQAISILAMEGKRMNKDANLIGRSQGLDAADQFMKSDPTAVMNRFHSAWDNLLTSLGAPLVPTAMAALNSLSGALTTLFTAASQHPDAVKNIGMGAGALGASLVGFGAYKIGSAAYNVMTGAGLSGSAVALNGAAAALTQAAVALGGGGAAGSAAPGAAAAGASWFGRFIPWLRMAGFAAAVETAATLDTSPEGLARQDATTAAIKKWWNTPSKPVQPVSPVHPFQNPRGAGSNITVNPQIQATNTINIDGKALAKYVTDMVIKAVSGMNIHPTAAPMAPSMSTMPAVDGSTSGGMF